MGARDLFDLKGQVALVTGGSRGLGLQIAEGLGEMGCKVAITARKADELAAGKARLEKAGIDVLTIVSDLGKPEGIPALVDAVLAKLGGIDILVNNAGVGVFKPVADMSVADWHTVMDTNLTGVFYCCHAALPHLRQRGGGWIINISSLASRNAFVNGAAYCASKSALNAFSESLMQEVRYEGIGTLSRPLTSNLDLQVAAGAEISHLDRTDDELPALRPSPANAAKLALALFNREPP